MGQADAVETTTGLCRASPAPIRPELKCLACESPKR